MQPYNQNATLFIKNFNFLWRMGFARVPKKKKGKDRREKRIIRIHWFNHYNISAICIKWFLTNMFGDLNHFFLELKTIKICFSSIIIQLQPTFKFFINKYPFRAPFRSFIPDLDYISFRGGPGGTWKKKNSCWSPQNPPS